MSSPIEGFYNNDQKQLYNGYIILCPSQQFSCKMLQLNIQSYVSIYFSRW